MCQYLYYLKTLKSACSDSMSLCIPDNTFYILKFHLTFNSFYQGLPVGINHQHESMVAVMEWRHGGHKSEHRRCLRHGKEKPWWVWIVWIKLSFNQMSPDSNIEITVDKKMMFLAKCSLDSLKNWPNIIKISVQLSITDL